MLTSVTAGPYTIRGVSVGGVYTCLAVPELDVVFDMGIAPRSFVGANTLLLSHCHVDHVGALPSFLGIRALAGKTAPLRVLLPAQTSRQLKAALEHLAQLQRYDLDIDAVPMEPGSELQLRADLWVRAFRTFHPVPSLGYQLFRRVDKLKPEFRDLPGEEIGRRRRAGEPLFECVEHLELAYATDTLARVLETEPSILTSRVLILECTFLDERKSLETSHAGCHIHLDELIAKADAFRNQHLVLMHFSQIYKPRQVVDILRNRCPPELYARIVPLVPDAGDWPG